MLVLRASIWCRAHQISSLTNFFQLLHSTKHSTKFRRLFLRADAPSPHSHLNPKPRATKCTEVPPGQRRTPGAKPLLSQRDSRMTFVVRRTPGANSLISSRNCTQRGWPSTPPSRSSTLSLIRWEMQWVGRFEHRGVRDRGCFMCE